MLTIDIDVSELAALGRSCERAGPIVREEVGKAGRQAGMVMVAQAVAEAPVNTGHLRASIGPPKVEQAGAGVRVEVATHAEYAKAVHDGRRAVVIRPVRAKALKFEAGGGTVFAMRANQPARAGNPFMARGLAKAASKLEKVFADALIRATRRALGA
jgi:hypothetical protein